LGRHLSRFYSSIENLWNRPLDGLIVTGAEPRTASLTEEPYWPSLTKVIDWAEHNTHSAIWSCLAAHAAVLHLDGIARRRLSDKCFGLFECARVSDHPLLAGLPQHLVTPHSRWNDLPEADLTERGYRILTRSADAGVDLFAKQKKSLFVFFQGHPEYETNTLLLEYKRDIGRYLKRERETYPAMPRSYFDASTADALTALHQKAVRAPSDQLLSEVPSTLMETHHEWHPFAASLYRNWLLHLRELQDRPVPRIPTLRAAEPRTPVSGS